MDLDPVEHEIEVKARLTYNTETQYDVTENEDSFASSGAMAYLGYASFTIDTVRFAKSAGPFDLE